MHLFYQFKMEAWIILSQLFFAAGMLLDTELKYLLEEWPNISGTYAKSTGI